ncbi:MAG: aldehyde dehydrogenase family protein [Gammaproteobacteria bacterium]|nr:aldehyde dehydrogenase family protein [Gammaproteobacteria bacterium]
MADIKRADLNPANTSLAEKFRTMEYGVAPEDSALSLAWLDQFKRRFGHFIGGAWTAPAQGRYFETSDPSTGEKIADIAQGSPADVDAGVKAARGALQGWQALTPHARARYLYALARQVQKHSRRLSVLETIDNGKPIRESRDIDIPLVARHFYYHAGWAQLLGQEFAGYQACGVVGQIIPWNFPLLMLAWKIAPALAAGNTVVLKPAEFTPLTALAFAELCIEVGLPPGVVNIVTGDGATGQALVVHPDVDKIAFTGSTEVGRAIRRATADSHKKLSLELGGKSPFVVFEDADLDSAVEGLVDGIWLNQGQVCCAGSRLLMQESIAAQLSRKLQARMATLRVGPPLDKTTDIGAIVARVQLERIEGLVAQGVAEGATCWQPDIPLPPRGLYYKPTLFTNVHPTSVVAQQEIFGPVLAAMTFRTPAEAVELANNTAYGLAASVWSESVNVALQVAARIKAGVVWVNSTNLFDAASGFGGYRESGFGREGGREGLREYLEPVWFRKAPLLARSPQRESEAGKAVGGAAGHGAGSAADTASGRAADTGAQAPIASHAAASTIDGPAGPEIDTLEGHPIDRTVKLYIGGKQVRADSGYSIECRSSKGVLLGEVPLGNRKDIRNAVEAAGSAQQWGSATAHNRAQVLYYLAENLSQRAQEIVTRLAAVVGRRQASRELKLGVERLFSYAAWADKYEGAVHSPPFRNISLAMNEALGTVGVICPESAPLLGFLSLVLPLMVAGNCVVAVPSAAYPLIAGDLYQVLETSDVPGGVLNIVTGRPMELMKVLAEHDDVDALWCYGDETLCATAKRLSAGNLKQVWTNEGRQIDFFSERYGEGRWYLDHAHQVKNIWVPYGE